MALIGFKGTLEKEHVSREMDIEPAAIFVTASGSGAAVPVSEPLEPEEMRDLFSNNVVYQVAEARQKAGVA